MELATITILIFVVSIAMIELIRYAWSNTHSAQRTKIRKRLKKFAAVSHDAGNPDIIRKRVMSHWAALDALLANMPGMRRLDHIVLQANAKHCLDYYLFTTLFIAVAGFSGASFYIRSTAMAVAAGLSLAILPFLQLSQIRRKRIEKFQSQLPEGLEMIARALKAGHAFSSGMKLAADQFSDPLGPEFAETLDEINFGVSIPDALRNLAARIDCPEIKYFVIAVILQRETGGNLAEIVDSLAHLIREKFKLRGKIRTLAAEGKLSALVLVCLPFFIVGYMHTVNPDYIGLLITEPIGRMMLLVAGIMMVVGILVMRKMIQIKI